MSCYANRFIPIQILFVCWRVLLFNECTVPPLLSGPQMTGFLLYLAYQLYSNVAILFMFEKNITLFCPNTHLCLPNSKLLHQLLYIIAIRLSIASVFTHRATCRQESLKLKPLQQQKMYFCKMNFNELHEYGFTIVSHL